MYKVISLAKPLDPFKLSFFVICLENTRWTIRGLNLTLNDESSALPHTYSAELMTRKNIRLLVNLLRYKYFTYKICNVKHHPSNNAVNYIVLHFFDICK